MNNFYMSDFLNVYYMTGIFLGNYGRSMKRTDKRLSSLGVSFKGTWKAINTRHSE